MNRRAWLLLTVILLLVSTLALAGPVGACGDPGTFPCP